ncbi:S26 family signal peptidase, partial [Bacillus cereus]
MRLSYELLPVFLFIMVVRTYIVEPYAIPSESMYPNLTTGDYILVSKSSYGFKFPFTNYTLINWSKPQ